MPQSRILVTLTLPPTISGADVQAYAHGPTTGTVAIPTENQVTFSLPSLQPGNFFEGRVLMPKSGFTNGVAGTLTKATIRAQEEQFIADTLAEQESEKTLFAVFLSIAGISFLLVLFVTYNAIRHFWKYGKDDALPQINQSGTLWEPPSDIDPAQVEQLMFGSKELTKRAFVATVLSLVQSRFYKIVRSDQKEGFLFKNYRYFLVELPTPATTPSSIQSRVIEIISNLDREQRNFQGKEAVAIPLDGFVKWAQKNQTSAQLFFTSTFKEIAFDENLTEGFFDATAHEQKRRLGKYGGLLIGIFVLNFVLGIIFITLFDSNSDSIALAILVGFVLGGTAVLSSIFVFFLLSRAEKRTAKGLTEAASWLAFQKHLSDYNKTKNYPIDSIILWEKYLVY